jgi:fructokinase
VSAGLPLICHAAGVRCDESGPEMAGEASVTVIGEALIDLVPAGGGSNSGLWRAAPGGSPANVAVGLTRLGVPTRMGARLSADVFGRALRQHLADNGVDLSASVSAPEATSLAVVSVAPDGSAEYDFRVQGTADWQWTDTELAELLPDPAGGRVAIHTGSLAATSAPGADPLRRLIVQVRKTATVSYDPNCRPLLMGDLAMARDRIAQLVALADVVKASEDDLRWLHPDRRMAELAAEWRTTGPALVVVTLGEHGALAAAPAGIVQVPGRAVAVVDTVGAGDSFMAALLAGLATRDLLGADRRPALRSMGIEEIEGLLSEAVVASALTCTRAGADPPTAAELAAALSH